MDYSQKLGRRVFLRMVVFFTVAINLFLPVSASLPSSSSSPNTLVNFSILKRLIFLKLRNESSDDPFHAFLPVVPTETSPEEPIEKATEDSTELPDGLVETSTLISLMTEVVRAAQNNATDATKAQSLFSEALPRLRSFLQANNGTQSDGISQLMNQVSPVISFLLGSTNATSNTTIGNGLSDFSNRTARGWGGGGCGGGCESGGCGGGGGGGYMIPYPMNNNNQDNTLQTLLPLLFGLIALLIMKLPT